MESALQIILPTWLIEAGAACPPLAGAEARMGFVIDLAARSATGDGGPFAAAVFERDSGRLLAAGVNRVVAGNCSAAHAELLALSLAQRAFGSFDLGAPGLPACELVSSAEPCLMCLGATLWSGVRRLLCAASDADVRAIGFDEGPKPPAWADELRRRGIEVVEGLLRPRAVAVLAAYRARGGMIYNGRAGSV